MASAARGGALRSVRGTSASRPRPTGAGDESDRRPATRGGAASSSIWADMDTGVGMWDNIPPIVRQAFRGLLSIVEDQQRQMDHLRGQLDAADTARAADSEAVVVVTQKQEAAARKAAADATAVQRRLDAIEGCVPPSTLACMHPSIEPWIPPPGALPASVVDHALSIVHMSPLSCRRMQGAAVQGGRGGRSDIPTAEGRPDRRRGADRLAGQAGARERRGCCVCRCAAVPAGVVVR